MLRPSAAAISLGVGPCPQAAARRRVPRGSARPDGSSAGSSLKNGGRRFEEPGNLAVLGVEKLGSRTSKVPRPPSRDPAAATADEAHPPYRRTVSATSDRTRRSIRRAILSACVTRPAIAISDGTDHSRNGTSREVDKRLAVRRGRSRSENLADESARIRRYARAKRETARNELLQNRRSRS